MTRARTNILFIVADDLAIWALGCYGNPEIRTPHIDAMAREGAQTAGAGVRAVCGPEPRCPHPSHPPIDIVGRPGVVAFHGAESRKTLEATYRPRENS